MVLEVDILNTLLWIRKLRLSKVTEKKLMATKAWKMSFIKKEKKKTSANIHTSIVTLSQYDSVYISASHLRF